MLKKSKLIVSLAILTIVATLFSGCFLFNSGDIKSISLESQPKTEYVQGEQFDTNFKVKVSYTDSSKEDVVLDYTNNQVEFENDFSSAAVGTYTCTISVKGQKSVTYSFSYSVVASTSVFTRGTGSKADPYVVTTADQFSHIAEESGKYYKLGNDIDLGTLPGSSFKYEAVNGFELDGQNYAIAYTGTSCFVFENLNNSTIKNLIVNVGAGAYEALLCGTINGDCTFENVTFNGNMQADNNNGMIVWRFQRGKITLRNCVNNVNISSICNRSGAFIGWVASDHAFQQTLVFENCVNNGNLDGKDVYVFISNGGDNAESITFTNCSNNGKVVGANVGLVACGNVQNYGTSVDDFAKTSLNGKIIMNSITADNSKFVAIGTYKTASGKDVTLVNDNGTVKFNSELNLPEGYTLKAFVRGYLVSGELGSVYVYTQTFGADFAVPYSVIKVVEGTSDNAVGAVTAVNGELHLTKNAGRYVFTGTQNANNQYYCYFIYDASGAMKYCGAIKYADMQNA